MTVSLTTSRVFSLNLESCRKLFYLYIDLTSEVESYLRIGKGPYLLQGGKDCGIDGGSRREL
jgi:hypothetical protein